MLTEHIVGVSAATPHPLLRRYRAFVQAAGVVAQEEPRGGGVGERV